MTNLLVLSFMLGLQVFAQTQAPAPAPTATTTPKNVKDEHKRCYESSECSLSMNTCCGGVAVNKKFAKLYEFGFNKDACQTVKCASISAVCVEQMCQVERAGRSKQ